MAAAGGPRGGAEREGFYLSELVDRLEAEHARLLALVSELSQAVEAGDAQAAAALVGPPTAFTTELDDHIDVEDHELFPTLAEELGQGVVGVFSDEHAEIVALRDRLVAGASADEVPLELCAEFCGLLAAHMEREDTALFPAARAVLS